LNLSGNTSVITLHHAAALASLVTEVLLYCTCTSTSTCQTRRYKCFKPNAKYTNYYHQRKHHLDDQAGSCLNLAAAMERNTRMVISRGILPPSTSFASATALASVTPLASTTSLASTTPLAPLAPATSLLSISPLSLSPLSLSPASTPLTSATSSVVQAPTVHAPTFIICKRRSSRLSSISQLASPSSSLSYTGAPEVNNPLNTRVLRKRA